jgi:protein TonB
MNRRPVSPPATAFVVLAVACALSWPAIAPALGYSPPEDCKRELLRSLLVSPTSAEVAPACGPTWSPWSYRGAHGAGHTLETYDAHTMDAAWAWRFARLLLGDAVIDSAHKQVPIAGTCATGDSLPVFLVSFAQGGTTTHALLRFDLGTTLFYTDDQPLGYVAMGTRADSLWSAMQAATDSSTALKRPRTRKLAPVQVSKADRSPSLGTNVYIEELPEAVTKVAPRYPESARQAGVDGTVLVQALVGRDGLIADAVVMRGPRPLYDAALDAVWQWVFKPALSNHKPVAVWVAIPVKFSLR